MQKICKLLPLLLALCLLCGCTTAAPPSGGGFYQFTDSKGNTVSLDAAPARVAVLFSSLADVFVSAGGTVAVSVGESVERGILAADTLLVDAGAGKTIDCEALIAAAPDFVITSADIPAQVEVAALLREIGIPVAELRVESFSDYLVALKICTDITGNTDALSTLGAAQKSEIDALIAAKPFEGKKILFVRAGSSARSVKAKGSADHFAATMLAELGAENIADTAPLLADGLSMEVILATDPDYIIFSPMGDEQASHAFVSEMLQDAEWQALSAVKSGNVAFLPKSLFHFKPNARWGEAYRFLAEVLV